jgi:deoxycytidylate deaminase
MTSTAMTLAISVADKSDHDKWRLGSVVWRGGSVLSTGFNRVKNDPFVLENEKHFRCTVHAEADAIRNAGDSFGAKLFVARVTPGGNLALAKPCSRCMDIIRECGIKKVYYTDENGEWTFFRVWS